MNLFQDEDTKDSGILARPPRLGLGGHQSAASKKDEWLTPPDLLKALGEFDLDPCAPIVRPWPMAKQHFTVEDNGLTKPWPANVRVFLNPPYGNETGEWLRRLAEHGHGTALIFARTETEMFFSEVWRKATAILFLEGRLYFYHRDGTRAGANAGAPSCLVAYGQSDADILASSGINGALVRAGHRREWQIADLFT